MTASHAVAEITEASVRDGLRALRYAKPLVGSPLLGLRALELRLRREGLHDSDEAKEWLLHRLVEA
jgi:hypothetical protein